MSSQRDPNRVPVMCYVPIGLVAKIKSHIAKKTVPNKVSPGKVVRKPVRPMCVSDFLIGLAEKRLEKCKVESRCEEWAEATLQRNLLRRKRQDEALAERRKHKAGA